MQLNIKLCQQFVGPHDIFNMRCMCLIMWFKLRNFGWRAQSLPHGNYRGLTNVKCTRSYAPVSVPYAGKAQWGERKRIWIQSLQGEKKHREVMLGFHSYLVDHTPNGGSVVTKDGLMTFSEAERFHGSSMRVASAGKPPHKLNGQFRTPPRRRRTRHSYPPSLPELN